MRRYAEEIPRGRGDMVVPELFEGNASTRLAREYLGSLFERNSLWIKPSKVITPDGVWDYFSGEIIEKELVIPAGGGKPVTVIQQRFERLGKPRKESDRREYVRSRDYWQVLTPPKRAGQWVVSMSVDAKEIGSTTEVIKKIERVEAQSPIIENGTLCAQLTRDADKPVDEMDWRAYSDQINPALEGLVRFLHAEE